MAAVSAKSENSRTAEVYIRLTEFEIPPMQDILLVGKRAPIGPEAAKRMVDALSPEQYEVVPVEEGPLEAMVVRKSLLKLIPKEKLFPIILEEGLKIATENMVIKAQIDVVVIIKRAIDL
ncbi:MAG: hypothetical protein ACYC4H_03820 [Desulfocucumaceae bacterium]